MGLFKSYFFCKFASRKNIGNAKFYISRTQKYSLEDIVFRFLKLFSKGYFFCADNKFLKNKNYW